MKNEDRVFLTENEEAIIKASKQDGRITFMDDLKSLGISTIDLLQAIDSLVTKDFVYSLEKENNEIIAFSLTSVATKYIYQNPDLDNPIMGC